MRFMIILRASRAIIPYLLERCWGLNSDTARRLGSVLSQGVEFAFVLLATDVIQGVISEPIANLLTLAVTLLMAPDRDSRSNGCGWQSQFSVVAGPRKPIATRC
jgi:Kef-type K+ transport system membrane component KefB